MPDYSKLYANELSWITKELMASARQGSAGIYWETLHRKPYGPLYLQSHEEIYNGNAGITLFFTALYRHTKQPEHLAVAESSFTYLLAFAEGNKEAHYTFYTGLTGILYVGLQLYEATHRSYYLEQVEMLTHRWRNKLIDAVVLDDLLSGHAGNLFLITQLYCYTQKKAHLDLLKKLLMQLIDRAKLSRHGLKWGYKSNALDSFTGMSHGACGIGHVLLEIYGLTKDPQLKWMGEKAFRYENEYFSKHLQSWVDLRIFPSHKEHTELKKKGIQLYLQRRAEINTWAHGLAGMALARLRAYQHVRKKYLLDDSRLCIEQTIRQMQQGLNTNYTLSTGYGSWVALFLEASQFFPQDNYHQYADALLNQAIRSRKEQGYYSSAWYLNQPDPALMVGYTGIGYLLLNRLNPGETPSILAPQLKHPTGLVAVDLSLSAKATIFGKAFQGTLRQLAADGSKIPPSATSLSGNKNELAVYIKQLRQSIYDNRLPSHEQRLLHEQFHIDLKSLQLSLDPSITLYREIRSDYFSENAEKIDGWVDADFYTCTFKRSRHLLILESSQQQKAAANQSGKHSYLLIRRDIAGIQKFDIGPFSYLLLSAIKKETNLQKLIKKIQQAMEAGSSPLPEEKIIAQLRMFVKQWFIEIMPDEPNKKRVSNR